MALLLYSTIHKDLLSFFYTSRSTSYTYVCTTHTYVSGCVCFPQFEKRLKFKVFCYGFKSWSEDNEAATPILHTSFVCIRFFAIQHPKNCFLNKIFLCSYLFAHANKTPGWFRSFLFFPRNEKRSGRCLTGI